MDQAEPADWESAHAARQRYAPGLWLVATPVGNLADMTPRGIEALRQADLVLAEDTRIGRKLLSAFGIQARLERCDEAATAAGLQRALPVLEAGGRVAFISDAGTPGVSDPGARLVAAVAAAGHRVSATPGPSAAMLALSLSGFAATAFHFAGFVPSKPGARAEFLSALDSCAATLLMFETAPRVQATLAVMADLWPARRVCLFRELTKLHEETLRGTPASLAAALAARTSLKGEIVLAVEGRSASDSGPGPEQMLVDRALKAAVEHGPVRQAAAMVAAVFNLPRRQVYNRALELKGEDAG